MSLFRSPADDHDPRDSRDPRRARVDCRRTAGNVGFYSEARGRARLLPSRELLVIRGSAGASPSHRRLQARDLRFPPHSAARPMQNLPNRNFPLTFKNLTREFPLVRAVEWLSAGGTPEI